MWWPCRIATLNSRIINKAGIPCVVYIDDTVLLCRPDIAKEQERIVEKFYSLSGWKMSTSKKESHLTDKVVKVLGVNYVRSETSMEMEIPEKKIEETRDSLKEVIKHCKAGKGLKVKSLPKAHGRCIFATSLEPWRPNASAIRALGQFGSEAAMYKSFRDSGTSAILAAATKALEGLKNIKGIKIDKESAFIQIRKSLSDAATPETPMMGGILPHHIGERDPEGWSVNWKQLFPENVEFWKQPGTQAIDARNHIGIWELAAVWINLRMFKEEYRGKKVYVFCDNSGDVNILMNATSNCFVCQLIAEMIIQLLKDLDCCVYFLYINTERNPADFLTRDDKLYRLFEKYKIRIVDANNVAKEFLREFRDRAESSLRQHFSRRKRTRKRGGQEGNPKRRK